MDKGIRSGKDHRKRRMEKKGEQEKKVNKTGSLQGGWQFYETAFRHLQ